LCGEKRGVREGGRVNDLKQTMGLCYLTEKYGYLWMGGTTSIPPQVVEFRVLKEDFNVDEGKSYFKLDENLL
jgi:hypothetical protein